MMDFDYCPNKLRRSRRMSICLYFCLIGMSVFFTLLITGFILYFSIKYRRGNVHADRSMRSYPGISAEISLMAILAVLSMGIFAWGASLYLSGSRAPSDGMEVRAVAKQWMWKFQHANGRREINELHIPLGTPVKLAMISEDVIHSLYVPAFRIKRDVLPGSYASCWFQATRTGDFHLFCAEYCGTNHSRMVGRIVVMEPADYETWLGGTRPTEAPAVAGERVFENLRCHSCHRSNGTATRGPPLSGLFGHEVRLSDGQTVVADDNYLRESILRPAAKVVFGFPSIMPTYDGQVDEEQLIQLISYIKSLAQP